MAWSTNDIYQFVLTLLRKNQSGDISTNDLFYNWNASQSKYMSSLKGRFQRAAYGKDGMDTGLIENKVILTKLTPFTQNATLAVTSGQAIKPNDWSFTLAMRCNNTKVFYVTHDSKWAVQQDVIDPPSITDNSYYYTEYQNYYQLLPPEVTEIEIDYLQTVTDIVWAYTVAPNGQFVYDAVNSVQPKWDQGSIVEITEWALKPFGISFSSQDVQSYGQSVEMTGQ